jgi:hypothetical protein
MTVERETITVSASRLASGTYDHEHDREIGTGDIHASYSADTIATSGKIRHLFRHAGNLLATVGMSGAGGIDQAEAYRVVPAAMFKGEPTTYREKVHHDGGETARNDPLGFYNGMKAVCGGKQWVMQGPPVRFVAEPERPDAKAEPVQEQMSLFG